MENLTIGEKFWNEYLH